MTFPKFPTLSRAIVIFVALVAPPVTVLAAPAPTDQSVIAHKTEGVEHPLIRQFMANPELVATKKSFPGASPFTGDRNDKAALKEWAGTEADVLAWDCGYIGHKFHEEIRVKAPDTMAYVIEGDPSTQTLRVVEYSASAVATPPAAPATTTANNAGTSSFTFTQVVSLNAGGGSDFIGPQDGTTILPTPFRSHEYMYVG